MASAQPNGAAATAAAPRPVQPAWQRATARPKIPQYTEPSVGTALNLGEFQDAPSLSNSEARLILTAITKRRAETNPGYSVEALQQMQDYLDMFARFKTHGVVNMVDTLFQTLPDNVSSFERSQLKTLVCADADEAKTLIPSLMDKIDDASLERILQEMTNIRNQGDE